jgi:hypothetical protein
VRRALICSAALLAALPALAEQTGVSATRHNLSVSGPGEIKAKSETEVCKFCHIPHNALVSAPLWGHALSKVTTYAVPQVRKGPGTYAPAQQPDGASRLCLSCHDGTVALGDIGRGGSQVQMAGPQRLEAGRRSSLGTDLSGSHPVSIVMPDIDVEGDEDVRDIGVKPRKVVVAEGKVPVDSKGKIQCTTCHDPHSDQNYAKGRVPHFWVRHSVEEVCLACHELR